jgi:mono/diheme cytochrome c family protein
MLKQILVRVGLLVVLLMLGASLQKVQAENLSAQDSEDAIRGAMLYDRWYAALGEAPPSGDMPLWSHQTTNTHSGEDTWRCVSCHGWDYQGRDGAYRYGSNYTGFPGVYSARDKGSEEIIAVLKGGNNTEHDFSAYLDDKEMGQLAEFITTSLIDDTEYINPQTLEVIGGDIDHGQELFTQTCSECHGEDGKTINFRFEGRDAWIGTIATLDPWRFLHKTRFGTPGTHMAIGAEKGWTPQDGRDVLVYARSLYSGLEAQDQAPALESQEETSEQVGGPATSLWAGILTAMGAVATGLGFAVMIGGILIGIILIIVWVLRGQKS